VAAKLLGGIESLKDSLGSVAWKRSVVSPRGESFFGIRCGIDGGADCGIIEAAIAASVEVRSCWKDWTVQVREQSLTLLRCFWE